MREKAIIHFYNSNVIVSPLQKVFNRNIPVSEHGAILEGKKALRQQNLQISAIVAALSLVIANSFYSNIRTN